jgi:hypothetical protein
MTQLDRPAEAGMWAGVQSEIVNTLIIQWPQRVPCPKAMLSVSSFSSWPNFYLRNILLVQI